MSLKDMQASATRPPGWGDGGAVPHDIAVADSLSGARRWAINEVGAAMAHQLVEPLTALLLYMHEVKCLTGAPAAALPASTQAVVADALRETERLCAIVEQIGNRFEGPSDSESAIAFGRDAISWWNRTATSDGGSGAVPSAARSGHRLLTPREREVLKLITGGDTNKEGALRLKISPRTFEAHRAQIMRKLGARNAADLLRKVLLEAR